MSTTVLFVGGPKHGMLMELQAVALYHYARELPPAEIMAEGEDTVRYIRRVYKREITLDGKPIYVWERAE